MRRRILTIIGLVLIIFAGGIIAIIVNNNARAFSPVNTVPGTTASISGNGGNAVMAGHYLYFIGNFVARSTITFRQNEHNNVTYGAIYRVRLDETGRPVGYDNTWLDQWEENQNLTQSELEILYGDSFNARFQSGHRPQLIVPKIAGHEASAMWIFGNHLIYTSPHNRQDRQGNLQSNRLDFFRVDLNGANHRHLFTTRTANLTRDDFTVVWSGGDSWLLVNDGGRLVRVGVSRGAGNTHTIANNATSFAFPIVTSFGLSDPMKGFNPMMQFVYFTEDRPEQDRNNGVRGNIMRRFRISAAQTEEIGNDFDRMYRVISVRGGHFIFEIGDWGPGDQSRNPVLYVADRDARHLFLGTAADSNFRALDTFHATEQFFAPTETAGTAFRFFSLVNNNLLLYTRNQSPSGMDADGNRFQFNRVIATGVEEIINITSNRIFYFSTGMVHVIDFEGATIDSHGDRLGGASPTGRVDQINISTFHSLNNSGHRTSVGEFFFYIRTITSVDFVDATPDDPGRPAQTMTIPVIVDREGRAWRLVHLDDTWVSGAIGS